MVVCIATYRRPAQLALLLGDIASQTYRRCLVEDASLSPRPRVAVAVADNDPDHHEVRPAETVVDEARTEHPGLDLFFVHETRPGVSHARNASVACAPAATYVAFIDDDERPSNRWLDELLAVRAVTDATVVVGPVVEVLPDAAPQWYTEGGFADEPGRADASPIGRCYAGNMLVCRRSLDAFSPPFDDRFQRTGGEDTFLSHNLTAAGASMVWAAEALVTTEVPLDRLTLGFVLRREFVGASSFTRGERIVYGFQPKRLVFGSGRMLIGLSSAAVAGLLGRRGTRASGLGNAARGAGVIAGALGIERVPGWW